MILEKIEKYSELSFSQDNQAQSKAALQSCYYNLRNLKTMIQKNPHDQSAQIPTISKSPSLPNHRVSQTKFILPEISITNMRNQQLFCNSGALQSLNNQNSLKYSQRQNVSFNQSGFRSFSNKMIGSSGNFELSQNVKQTVKKFVNSEKENKNQRSISKEKKVIGKCTLFRSRKAPKIMLGLSKNQKYFEQSQVKLSQDVVQKIGLYQATNLYKKSNVDKFLREGYDIKFRPVINLKFATFSMCNRNEFFLTDNGGYLPELNQADSYLDSIKKSDNGSSKVKVVAVASTLRKSEEQSNEKTVTHQLSRTKIEEDRIIDPDTTLKQVVKPGKNFQWLLTIQNYEIVKNQQFYCFKKDNIDDWNEIKFIIHYICLYLRKVKISLLSFKFDKQVFMKQLWSCQRIRDQVLEKLLKIKLRVKDDQKQNMKTIKLFNTRAEVIGYLMLMWRDRQYLIKMKKTKQKEKQRLIWSAIRITAKHKMRIALRKRAARAQLLNQRLRNGDWDYEVEIHIPSFSESDFVRSTTQYMEHYQNMFYHMWKSSNKQFVLIIPAINETILQLFQQKIKLHKNITLICPESHQLYPKSLPLAACLLYSKDALHKIKKLLEGKKGIIIPGRQVSNKFLYEEHLSDLLNCPIFSTLRLSNLLGDNKNTWIRHEVPTAIFTQIKPKSSIQLVIQKLSELILEYPMTKMWVFKMNHQFNGRGIAKFDADSSKKLKQILSLAQFDQNQQSEGKHESKLNERRKKQIRDLVISYLETHFRLKLKINFQNCIFRVEQYIEMFLKKGGIIQQYLQDCQTYQFCYKLQPGYSNYSHLFILDQIQQEKYISCAQNYELDFVTKLSLFASEVLPKPLKNFSKIAQRLLKQQRYLGYVSVTVLYSPKKQQCFAVQAKPYMTINSSMSYLLKTFTSKKVNNPATNRRNGNLVSHKNINSRAEIPLPDGQYLNHSQNKLIFLFVPYIVFTDVDDQLRSQIIENLVVQSWQNISQSLLTQSVVCQSPDSFHGTLYMSLGLTLGILIYGKSHDLRKMKSKAIECSRQLSDKIESVKLYRGKQETRDVFQFGDLIRAITKIKS